MKVGCRSYHPLKVLKFQKELIFLCYLDEFAVALCLLSSCNSVASEVDAPRSSCDFLCLEMMLHHCAFVVGWFGSVLGFF